MTAPATTLRRPGMEAPKTAKSQSRQPTSDSITPHVPGVSQESPPAACSPKDLRASFSHLLLTGLEPPPYRHKHAINIPVTAQPYRDRSQQNLPRWSPSAYKIKIKHMIISLLREGQRFVGPGLDRCCCPAWPSTARRRRDGPATATPPAAPAAGHRRGGGSRSDWRRSQEPRKLAGVTTPPKNLLV